MDRGGPHKRVDDAELECDSILVGDCDSILVGDCDNGSEKDDGLERVMDLDLGSRLCDWYSEGVGKYVCRGDVEIGLRPLPREYILLWDITVLVRIGGDRWKLSGGGES